MGFPLCFSAYPAVQFLAPFRPAVLAAPFQNLQYLLSILPGGTTSRAEHPAVCRRAGSGQGRAAGLKGYPVCEPGTTPALGRGDSDGIVTGMPCQAACGVPSPGGRSPPLCFLCPLCCVLPPASPSASCPAPLALLLSQSGSSSFPEPPGSLLTFLSLILIVCEIPAAFKLLSSTTVSWLYFCRALGCRLRAFSALGCCYRPLQSFLGHCSLRGFVLGLTTLPWVP